MDTLLFTLSRIGEFNVTVGSHDPFYLDNVEEMGQRMVHSVRFDGLTGNTTYKLVVSAADSTVLKEINYKTVPDNDTSELRLAIGGDVGMTKSA